MGKQIGANNIKTAKRVQKFVFKIAMLTNVIICSLLYLLRDEMIFVFTEDRDIIEIYTRVVPTMILALSMDFVQCTLFGTILALT